MDAFYDIQESWSFIWKISTVKKEMRWRFNIITTAADRVKWILKTMFQLMLTKMILFLLSFFIFIIILSSSSTTSIVIYLKVVIFCFIIACSLEYYCYYYYKFFQKNRLKQLSRFDRRAENIIGNNFNIITKNMIHKQAVKTIKIASVVRYMKIL